ncbi:hypothetical protein [Polyangium jinanense]|uniref:Uncharacterized protein n=1 Tax=Polyangium jinanense TaxID=2829994 RepID=A0A9X3XEQ5_9BACT|nr:hypothetical protein [Polyangium jinanense]MDC3962752.1 hypothetical protein [Polyangium jinanense]MDC3989259.1 hypothetical protein [Polyangium jinanense]
MPPVDPVPDVAEALRPLASLLVTIVREEAAKQAKGDEGPRYYDKKTFPWGERAFERLTVQGKLRSFKAPDGKTILVLREEAHAFIEAQEGARPRAPRPPPQARALAPEEITTDMIGDAMMRGEGVRQRGQGTRRRNGPATRRSP